MNNKFLKFGSVLSGIVIMLSLTTTKAMASDALKGITGDPGGNDIFGGVTKVVTDTGNSAINMLTVCGAVAVVIGVIICGISIVLFKGDQEMAKNKKYLLAAIGASCLIFGAIGFSSGLAKVGNSVGESFKQTESTSSDNTPQQKN